MKYRKPYVPTLFLLVALAFPTFWQASADSQKPAQEPKKAEPQKKDDKKKAEEENQDEQVIKLDAALVTVPFNITDKSNRFINDLTKDDIEVLEDNKAQEIFSFERQTDLPLTIAMLIDISGSQAYTLPIQISTAQRFFQKVLRPKKDLGAVVTFEHETELVQDLTSNVDRLQHALNDVRIPVSPAMISGGRGTPPINGGSNVGATAVYDAIYTTSADLLSREAGRRVIILLTDGQDTASRVKMKDAIQGTWRNEIIVYAIGISGITGINEGDLKKICNETGGRAFFPRGEEDLDKAFRQIEEDLRSQNILSYASSNEARDGSFRTIQVRVKNRKDLTVRHRRGYFARKEGA